MAKFYTELDNSLRRFIAEQKIFFTASAPNDGRVNLSPKGMDSFRCLDSKTVAYLDLTGSGNETAAHIFENGRLTIMFCSFTEKPLILRLYGRGRVVRKNDEDWNRLYSNFTPIVGERQIIVLEIESLQTSCGFAVPVYELKEEREKLVEWAENKGENGLLEYRQTKNQISIDGLPTHLNG
ncbi:MAG TPA: pyridoxamine 5'-phosphate oxidase family protein [Pyrinomonadaceae bacterium]|nr:pyridoxamine 5'-phosphate oxidase family protein [Pyrinomonadaceae bacterium]